MNKQPVQDDNARSNAVKDPDDWATGEETMTGAQASYTPLRSEPENPRVR
jgi:hypothetical protein